MVTVVVGIVLDGDVGGMEVVVRGRDEVVGGLVVRGGGVGGGGGGGSGRRGTQVRPSMAT
jgi:hypothetical protein